MSGKCDFVRLLECWLIETVISIRSNASAKLLNLNFIDFILVNFNKIREQHDKLLSNIVFSLQAFQVPLLFFFFFFANQNRISLEYTPAELIYTFSAVNEAASSPDPSSRRVFVTVKVYYEITCVSPGRKSANC